MNGGSRVLAHAASFAAVAAVLNGCASKVTAPPPKDAVGSSDLATLLLHVDTERARAAGAGTPTVLASGAGVPGDNLGGRTALAEGSCALFLARGTPSIDDLDLFVYADDGAPLGSDESPDRNASVLVCAPRVGHVYAFARVAAGHGLVAVSAQLLAPSAADRVLQAVAARPAPAIGAPEPQAWPNLEEDVAAHLRGVGGSWKEVRRAAIPLEPLAPTRLSGIVPAGQCLDLFVAPSDEVAYVELTAEDLAGRIIGQSGSEPGSPSLVLCSRERAELAFALRPHGGRGLAAIVLSNSVTPPPFNDSVYLYEAEAEVPLPAARVALAARLKDGGYGPVRVAGEGASRVAHRESVSLRLPGGCARLDVVGGAPARGLAAWLWSDRGALVAHDDGPAVATSFACGSEGTARLDVEAVTRGGPFAVELRPLGAPSAVLDAHPLAAGRFLASVAERTPSAVGVTARAATAVSLSALAVDRREVALDPEACLTVTVALGAGAEGVELRLSSPEPVGELAFSRGTNVASVTTCNPGPPRSVTVEARAAIGAADGVIGVVKSRAAAAPRPGP